MNAEEIKQQIKAIFYKWQERYKKEVDFDGDEVYNEIDAYLRQFNPLGRYWLSEGCEDCVADLVQFDEFALFMEFSGEDVYVDVIYDGVMSPETAKKLAHYLSQHPIIEVKI